MSISRNCGKTSWRRSFGAAKPSPSTAGGRTCTIRGSNAGCTGIDLSTLLLWGAEDRIVTPAYGEGWRQAIPRARLELIHQAGHFPYWEQPEAFVERLSVFVDKNS